MAQPDDDLQRRGSPTATRFKRSGSRALQQGFLPEPDKTAFAPMRGASFKTDGSDEGTSDLEQAAPQSTWRPPFLGAWTSTGSTANSTEPRPFGRTQLVTRPSWWSPPPPNPFTPPSPISPRARAIKPWKCFESSGSDPQLVPVGSTGPPNLAPGGRPDLYALRRASALLMPEGAAAASLSPLARPITPPAAHVAPLEAPLTATPQPQQPQQPQPPQPPQPQPQPQLQPQLLGQASAQAVSSSSSGAAEPGSRESRRQTTFLTGEVETVGLGTDADFWRCFEDQCTVGRGHFAKVKRVRHGRTGDLFAAKILGKDNPGNCLADLVRPAPDP